MAVVLSTHPDFGAFLMCFSLSVRVWTPRGLMAVLHVGSFLFFAASAENALIEPCRRKTFCSEKQSETVELLSLCFMGELEELTATARQNEG